MKGLARVLVDANLGALLFWAPDLVLHALSRDFGAQGEPRFLTLFLPVITALGFLTALGYRRWEKGMSLACLMLLGIWVLGPLYMTISATFSGGGFQKPEGWTRVWLGTALFPIFTPTMATYDGTLFGLLLSSGFLLLSAVLAGLFWLRSSKSKC